MDSSGQRFDAGNTFEATCEGDALTEANGMGYYGRERRLKWIRISDGFCSHDVEGERTGAGLWFGLPGRMG